MTPLFLELNTGNESWRPPCNWEKHSRCHNLVERIHSTSSPDSVSTSAYHPASQRTPWCSFLWLRDEVPTVHETDTCSPLGPLPPGCIESHWFLCKHTAACEHGPVATLPKMREKSTMRNEYIYTRSSDINIKNSFNEPCAGKKTNRAKWNFTL